MFPERPSEGEQIRLLLWGDVEGEFGPFEESLNRAVSKFGKFDLCICTGNFFGHVSSIESVRSSIPIVDRVRSLLPTDLPIAPIYIFDQPIALDSLGGELFSLNLTAPLKINDIFTILPHKAFCELSDRIRIATCAHHPLNTASFSIPSPPPDWTVIDLCLVSAWPENLQAGLQGDDLLILQNHLINAGQENPVRARNTFNYLTSLPLVRYIVATGGPKIFYQRPPFQRTLDSPVPTRFVSLSPMLLSSKPSTLPRKFLHALRVAPWALQPTPQPPVSRIANSPIPPAKRFRTRFDQWPEVSPAGIANATPSSSLSSPSATTASTALPKADQQVVLSSDTSHWTMPQMKRRESSISESLSDSAIAPAEPKTSLPKVTLYVSNVPYGSNGDDIRRVVDPVARSVRVRFPRLSANEQKIGRAWVSFATLEDAQKVLNSPPIELNGRKLRFNWAKNSLPDAIRASSPAEELSVASNGQQQVIKIDTRPHQECWFCLINPNCERGLICHVGKNVREPEMIVLFLQAYLAVARGGINAHHCLILPSSHEPNIGYSNSAALIDECNAMMDMMVSVNAREGMGTIFYERYLPMKYTRTMHTQIHSIGIERSELQKLKHQFVYKIMEEGAGRSPHFDWRLYEEAMDIGSILNQLNQQQTLTPKFTNETYWWISIQDPGEPSFVPCTFLGVSGSSTGVNLNLAREIITQTLNLPDRVQWKNCVTPAGQEAEAASRLKQLISNHLRNNEQS